MNWALFAKLGWNPGVYRRISPSILENRCVLTRDSSLSLQNQTVWNPGKNIGRVPWPFLKVHRGSKVST